LSEQRRASPEALVFYLLTVQREGALKQCFPCSESLQDWGGGERKLSEIRELSNVLVVVCDCTVIVNIGK
jgi:hypothetical protein